MAHKHQPRCNAGDGLYSALSLIGEIKYDAALDRTGVSSLSAYSMGCAILKSDIILYLLSAQLRMPDLLAVAQQRLYFFSLRPVPRSVSFWVLAMRLGAGLQERLDHRNVVLGCRH